MSWYCMKTDPVSYQDEIIPSKLFPSGRCMDMYGTYGDVSGEIAKTTQTTDP